MERWRKPWLSSDLIFGLTPLGREFKAHLKITHEFTSDVILNSVLLLWYQPYFYDCLIRVGYTQKTRPIEASGRAGECR